MLNFIFFFSIGSVSALIPILGSLVAYCIHNRKWNNWLIKLTGALVVYTILIIVLWKPVDNNFYSSIKTEGFEAAKNGLPPTACPYLNHKKHENWMLGWQEGSK